MATRKTPAKTPAGKTAAKSTTAARKRSATAEPPSPRAAATESDVLTSRKDVTQQAPAALSPEERYRAIAQAAYLRAEKRGFAQGHEIEDWLAAEAEFDAASKPAAG
jgi:hypothetical protein